MPTKRSFGTVLRLLAHRRGPALGWAVHDGMHEACNGPATRGTTDEVLQLEGDGRPGPRRWARYRRPGEAVGRQVMTRGGRRSAARLVAAWAGAAIGLGLLLALARSAQGPLDDPDQAWQRPGFLDAGELPLPAPTVAPGVPARGRPTVVFFVRPEGLGELCRALGDTSLPEKAAMTVVVGGGRAGRCSGVGIVVGDAEGLVARAYGMRHPRGGGPPVGYAVVDAAGAVRYRTLDPQVADQLDEVGTIVAALP